MRLLHSTRLRHTARCVVKGQLPCPDNAEGVYLDLGVVTQILPGYNKQGTLQSHELPWGYRAFIWLDAMPSEFPVTNPPTISSLRQAMGR